MATQRDASSALRCHAGDSGADCLVGRARLRAGPTPCTSPGGEGGEAEGRTPFAALSADARGGLKARSAFRQWTPPAYHPTCTRHEQAPGPCLRSACHRPHQRASSPRAASAGRGSRASRRGAAWRPCAGEPGPAAAARGTAAPARRGGADRSAARHGVAAGGGRWGARSQAGGANVLVNFLSALSR